MEEVKEKMGWEWLDIARQFHQDNQLRFAMNLGRCQMLLSVGAVRLIKMISEVDEEVAPYTSRI